MRIALLVVALGAATAHADPKTASALYADGQNAYQLQKYPAAAAKFLAAYDADPDPVYLFNAAQAFRFGNDCGHAAALYQRFLAKVPNPPNADKIRAWSDEMATCAKAHPTEPTGPVVTAPVVPVGPPPPPRDPGHATRGRAIGAAVSGGLGIVGLAIGAYYAKQGSDAQAEHDAVCPAPCTWMKFDGTNPSTDFAGRLKAADDKGHAANSRAVIAFAAGSLGVAAGIGLFLWSRGDEHASHVAIVPTTNGAMLSLAF